MRNFLEHLFWRTSANGCFWECSWNSGKEKIVDGGFQFYLKTGFFNISIRNKWKCICLCFIFHDWFYFWVFIYIQHFFDVVRNKLQTINIYILELIKRRSKVQEENISYKQALFFDQWKIFSENYKLIRVWLLFVDKFNENYCCLRLFSEFIQAQKRYPTSFDKIGIVT